MVTELKTFGKTVLSDRTYEKTESSGKKTAALFCGNKGISLVYCNKKMDNYPKSVDELHKYVMINVCAQRCAFFLNRGER